MTQPLDPKNIVGVSPYPTGTGASVKATTLAPVTDTTASTSTTGTKQSYAPIPVQTYVDAKTDPGTGSLYTNELDQIPAIYSRANVYVNQVSQTYVTRNTVVEGNLSGLGNIVTVNLDGNASNVLLGTGVFAAVPGGGANTGNVTFDDNIVIGTGDPYGGGGLYLAQGPDSVANLQYFRVRGGDNETHLHFDTGNNQFYDQYFGDDSKYLKLELGSTGNVVIGTYSGDSYEKWTFDSNGNLTVPGNIKSITTGFPFTSNVANVDTTTTAGAVYVVLEDDEFGGPETGQVTITGVVGTTEANNAWYYQAVETNVIQLYYDEALDYPVDGTGWPAYVSGGFANAPGYNNLSVTGGNVSIITNNGNAWTFTDSGTVYFPILTVDLHNGGQQSAQTLQFGDSELQAVITGPTPPVGSNFNAQRLIIQGQRGDGTGEGGDVYFWAGDSDTAGGDIKIYAGDADNVSAGYGGYVNIEGGSGFDNGGYVRMTAGSSGNAQGASAEVIGGQGGTQGGTANLQGGFGSVSGGDTWVKGGYGGAGPGGNTYISGGASANGAAEGGNIILTAGTDTWEFDNLGILNFPGNARIDTSDNNFEVQNANAINFEAASVVNIYTDTANVAYQWQFGDDGNLQLPVNTVAINFANGSPAFGNIVSVNLDSNVSNVLLGNGTWGVTSTDRLIAGNVSAVLESTGSLSLLGGIVFLDSDQNIKIGFDAGANNTSTINMMVGYQAGENNTGFLNDMLGYQAGRNNTGDNNTMLGYQAGESNTGDNNTMIGRLAGDENIGSYNTMVGEGAGQRADGQFNSFYGSTAGTYNVGDYNTLMGPSAGSNNNGNFNVSVGFAAGNNNNGAENVFIGREAGTLNSTGSYNIAIGKNALYSDGVGTGSNNIAIGENALYGGTSGQHNLAIGAGALRALTSGSQNIAIGEGSLESNTTGARNISIGENAMEFNTSGTENIGIGLESLRYTTSGVFNTSVGGLSLLSATSGSYNTALGYRAGYAITTASNNITVGREAGQDITTGSNNTIIGQLVGTAALASTVLIGAGSTERIKVDATGLYINGSYATNLVAVPASSIGQSGDVAGRIAANTTYFYYCTGTYDGVTNIWKRITWSGDTW